MLKNFWQKFVGKYRVKIKQKPYHGKTDWYKNESQHMTLHTLTKVCYNFNRPQWIVVEGPLAKSYSNI